MIVQSLSGLAAFFAYFFTGAALTVAYIFVYTRVTRHDEFALIIEEHNASASQALGLSMLGFALPLASAILHTVSILDCLIWGLIALVVQIAAYFIARLVHPKVSDAIAENSLAAALWLGFVSITAGVLSAVSMST